MFEVVEDQEEALAGEVRHERVAQGLLRPLSDAQSLRDCGSDQGRISQRRERDEDHAIGKRRATCSATASARRVLPVPPGPVRVSSRIVG